MVANNFIDLTGKTFGHLIVIGIFEKSSNNELKWECICECGNTTYCLGSNLRRNRVKTCGKCKYYKQIVSNITSTHGLSNTREFKIWLHFKERCFSINCKDYPNWGGRGITVFVDWINNFQEFYNYLQDTIGLAEDYETITGQKATLDRINVDGNYEPGNLKWSSYQEQQQNRTNNVLTPVMVKYIKLEHIIHASTASEIKSKMGNHFVGRVEAIQAVILKNTWGNIGIDDELNEYYLKGTIYGNKF